VIAAALIGLIVVGANPFEASEEGVTAVESIVTFLLILAFVAATFLKGRRLHGLIGVFFPPLAIYATCRVGKPNSPWASRRYGAKHPKKQAKAEARFHPGRRTDRFKEAFRDIVGGKPSEGLAHATEEAVGATRQAGEEMRAKAERVVHPADDNDVDGPKT
jgi:hypothetical protein